MTLVRTYTVDYTSTGDTIKEGVRKLDLELDAVYTNANATNTAVDVLTAADVTLQANITSVMMVSDQKASGTNAGGSDAGWNTRTLNTSNYNGISGASLAANKVILPAGTYIVEGRVPAYDCGDHKALLYNTSGGGAVPNPEPTELVYGSPARAVILSSGESNSWSFLHGSFVLNATSLLEVRHFTDIAKTSTGLGKADTSGAGLPEVYTVLKITKVA